MTVTFLRLQRNGKFAATSMRPNSHKCGSMSSKVYRYWVKVKATDARLTVEGFVLNNELIHDYFVKRFGKDAPTWDAMSCELMAVTSAREIAEMICNAGVDCREVEVSIQGSNGAMITATYEVNTTMFAERGGNDSRN